MKLFIDKTSVDNNRLTEDYIKALQINYLFALQVMLNY